MTPGSRAWTWRGLLVVAYLVGAVGCGGKAAGPVDRPSLEAGAEVAASRGARVVTQRTPHAFTARVWVDDSYRGRPLWRQQIAEQLAEATAYVEREFGATITLTIDAWPYRATHADVAALARDLASFDGGDGADWVIGYVGRAAVDSDTIDKLGAARLLGKHIILRELHSEELQARLAATFKYREDARSEPLYQRALRHRRLVVFVHEWAHTLGVNPETYRRTFMSSQLDEDASEFSLEAIDLMRLALDLRAIDGDDDQANAARVALLTKMDQVIRDAPPSRWSPGDRAEVLNLLARMGGRPVLDAAAQERAVVNAEAAGPTSAGRSIDADALAGIIAGAPATGRDGVPHTAVVAYEYGCDACVVARALVMKVVRRWQLSLRVVWIPVAPDQSSAMAAAAGACAAHRQGRFLAMDHALHAASGPDPASCLAQGQTCVGVEAAAGQAGLDLPRLRADLPDCVAAVRAAKERLSHAGAPTTLPVLILDGVARSDLTSERAWRDALGL